MYPRQTTTPEKRASVGDLPPTGFVPVYPAGAHGEEITLLDIWRVVTRYRATVLGATALAALSALAAALLMTPQYRAEVLLAPVSDPNENESYISQFGEFGGIAALAGINLNHKDRKSESVATLRSRQFTDQFILDRQLERVLFARFWDPEHERWKSEKDTPTPWDTFELFDKKVRSIREDKSTGLITLSIEWQDPELAAQWANELVASVNAVLRQRAVADSDRAIDFLQGQLTRTSVVELQQALHRLIESEMKKSILANINEEYAFKVIDPAVVPEEPVRPKVVIMTALGTAFGLILGIVAALVLNARRAAGNASPPKGPAGAG